MDGRENADKGYCRIWMLLLEAKGALVQPAVSDLGFFYVR